MIRFCIPGVAVDRKIIAVAGSVVGPVLSVVYVLLIMITVAVTFFYD